MNRAKDIIRVQATDCFSIYFWETIYESGQDVRTEHLIKNLYEVEDWKELHIALWSWLSLDGEREKHEWFERFNVPEVRSNCFACKVASTIDANRACQACPIGTDEVGRCAKGLHSQWVSTHKLAERKELANEIANMEWDISK